MSNKELYGCIVEHVDANVYSEKRLLNIGFGNSLVAERVISIVSPSAAPMKRLKDHARETSRLIDATCGRKTRSIIIMDSNHIILSAIQPETIANRFFVDPKKPKLPGNKNIPDDENEN